MLQGIPVVALVPDIISGSLFFLIRQLMHIHASVCEDPWDNFTHFLHACDLGLRERKQNCSLRVSAMKHVYQALVNMTPTQVCEMRQKAR